MVKIKGPLLSLGAHGSVADTLTYSKKRTGQQARKYNKPTVAPTLAQREIRRLTSFLVAHWQNMTTGQKATWNANALASGLRISGYHYFLREAQKNLYLHHGLAGYWPSNRIEAGKLADHSGSGHHLTFNWPAGPTEANFLAAPRPQLGKGLYVSAWNFKQSVASTTKLNITDAITVESILWLPGGAAANFGWFSKLAQFLFRYVAAESNQLQAFIWIGTDPEPGLRWTWPAARTDPIQVNVTYDKDAAGTNLHLYVNGILRHSLTRAGAIDTSANPLHLYNNDGNALYGRGCETTLYKRAMTAAEILARYKFATA